MHLRLLIQLLAAAAYLGSSSVAFAASRPWHLNWWHGRNLLQRASSAPQQQLAAVGKSGRGFPMCMWNDVKESCSPSHLVYLSLDAAPITVLHRAATTAYDRNLACSGHPDADSCHKDQGNRCFYWNRSCVGLDAYELVNWLAAGSTVNGDAALLDFTCPGSTAAQYKLCRSATDAGPKGVCNLLPGCQFVPVMRECLPKAFDDKSLAEVQVIGKAYNSVDQTVWGSCEGACYVRQATVCQQSYNSSSACKTKPYCVWEFDSWDVRNVCMHRDTAARGTDAFSQEYVAMKDACTKLKSQTSCEEPKVRAKHVGKFRKGARADPAVTTEAAVKCVL